MIEIEYNLILCECIIDKLVRIKT